MKKRAPTARSVVAKASALLSPPPIRSPDRPTKPYAAFDLTFVAASKRTLTPTPLRPRSSPAPPQQTVATISDLKNLAASHSESFKRRLDLSHSEILKEFDASKTRIAKRLKIQTQACLQLTEEAEKECKKMSDRIRENSELIKGSYAEFITEAQASACRVCKVSIPELAQSMEKAIEGLCSRYKVPANPM